MEGNHIWKLEDDVREWILQKPRYRYLNKSDIKVDFDDVTFSCEKPKFFNIETSEIREPNVVFSSTFNNKTDTTHESRVTIKRSTSAVGKIVLHHGFVADHIFGAKIQTPSAAQSVFKGVTTMDLKETNTMEETIDWTFTSLVRAAPRRQTDTHFEVKEEKLTANFSTYMVMNGPVNIEFKTNGTNETVQLKESVLKILDEVLPEATRTTPNTIFLDRDQISVRWPFRGEMSFHYGITQNERVE